MTYIHKFIDLHLVFNAQLVPESLPTDVIFPDTEDADAQIIIPAGAIIYQRSSEGTVCT